MAEETEQLPLNSYIENLYQRHAVALKHFACAKGASREDAEEMVQDVFIRLNQYTAVTRLHNELAFMRTAIVNMITDRHRQMKRQPAMVDYDECFHELPPLPNQPERHSSDEQLLQLMLDDVKLLSEEARQVFLLHRVHEKSYDAIAEQCGLTISVVRRLLRDTLLFLSQRRLEREYK